MNSPIKTWQEKKKNLVERSEQLSIKANTEGKLAYEKMLNIISHQGSKTTE